MKMTYTSPEMKLIGFAAAESLAATENTDGAVKFDDLLTQDQYGKGTGESQIDVDLGLDLFA